MDTPPRSSYNGHACVHYRLSYTQNQLPYLDHSPFLRFGQSVHNHYIYAPAPSTIPFDYLDPSLQAQTTSGPHAEAGPTNFDVGIGESCGDGIDHYHSNEPFATPLVSQGPETKGGAVKARVITGRVAKLKPPPPSKASTEQKKRKNVDRERVRRAQLKKVETHVFALVPELEGSDLIQKLKLEKCNEWIEEMTRLNAELERLLVD